MTPISVEGASYELLHRDLGSTLKLLLERVGHLLELPVVRSEDSAEEISALWHGSAYQQHLRQFVAAGADLDRDLLLPLLFFSGMQCCLLHFDCCGAAFTCAQMRLC